MFYMFIHSFKYSLKNLFKTRHDGAAPVILELGGSGGRRILNSKAACAT
jgi:hypothetical protein